MDEQAYRQRLRRSSNTRPSRMTNTYLAPGTDTFADMIRCRPGVFALT
jgi:predicted Zn-dependent protease